MSKINRKILEENLMKKLFGILLAVVLVFSAVFALAACGQEYELAVVTDIGSLMDKGFNQGTWEGTEQFAKANDKTYKYYQPANGDKATDADRIAAMELAVKNGAKYIVAPGFLQAVAIETVAKANPDVRFIFVDGWAMEGINNLTAIVYQEEQSGFFAGYAAVKDGYTKLGAVIGGGGSNPACNRFAYGYLQGASMAAKEDNKQVAINLSFAYGATFSASPELKTQVAGWYAAGTEIVFSCGGSMLSSVVAAASETDSGKIIGVDTDQSGSSDRVITSAVKGLSASVALALDMAYNDNAWDSKLGGKLLNLGAKDDATGLPTAEGSWRFNSFTVAQYEALFAKVVAGTVAVDAKVPGTNDNPGEINQAWVDALELDNITIAFTAA
jgi:basic membrane protein A